jgi:fatty-acyl-CoA synthase
MAAPIGLTQSYWPADRSDPVREITIGELLREATSTVPDRLALIHAPVEVSHRREWTYRELLATVEQVARALLTRFEPGDRIAAWAPNSGEWVLLQQGIAVAGMVLVAVNPAYRSSELSYMLEHSGAVALFHVDSYRDADLTAIAQSVRADLRCLREIISFSDWDDFIGSALDDLPLPHVAPRTPVQIQYTSGTTGFPKGALLHHKGLLNQAHFVGQRAGMSDAAVCINAMPMYHIGGGAVTEFATLSTRGTYVVMPAFDAGHMLELIETYQGTHSLMVPTMLISLLEHPDVRKRDLTCLQTVMSGAAAVAESLVHECQRQLGSAFSILFGQTEMHGVISQTSVTDAPADQAQTSGSSGGIRH